MKKKISLWLSPVFLASLLFAAPLAQAADPQLDRALFEASMHRVPERVGELLQKGADPNFEDAFGVTPLLTPRCAEICARRFCCSMRAHGSMKMAATAAPR